MKQRLRLKWLPIHPRPDPTFGEPLPRSSHGLSYLKNRNSFVIYGGEHIVPHRPVSVSQQCWECYLGAYSSLSLQIPHVSLETDPRWRRIDFRETNEHIPPLRIGPAQAVYGDRYLYMFGGRTGPPGTELNDFWMLDTDDWVWQRVRVNPGSDAAPHPRSQATMLCMGPSLYLFGGTNAQYGPLNDLHHFDLLKRTWRNLGRALHVPQAAHLLPIDGGKQLAVIRGGHEQLVGGHLYDLQLRRWEVEPLRGLTARNGGVAAVAPSSGVAVVFGGEGVPGVPPQQGDDAEYAPYSNDMGLLDATTGHFVVQVEAPKKEPEDEPDELVVPEQKYQKPWPEARAWSAFDGQEDEQGRGHFYMFGGIGGIDGKKRHQPLQDVWKLEVHKVIVSEE
jgi:Galactose oxidase, central domain/Kelch motif